MNYNQILALILAGVENLPKIIAAGQEALNALAALAAAIKDVHDANVSVKARKVEGTEANANIVQDALAA